MQNTIQKFRQSSIVFEKPGNVCKLEKFDELQLSYSSTFFGETLHTFSTYHCLQKGVWNYFFYLDLEFKYTLHFY